MLAAADGWGQRDGRPYLPRAFSVAGQARRGRLRLDFLVEAVGPGRIGSPAAPGRGLWVTGPLGRPFSPPRELAPDAPGRFWSAGASASRRWRSCAASSAAGDPVRTSSVSRSPHSGGVEELFDCSRSGWRARRAHRPRGYVTDLLAVLLEGDEARSGAVYGCGPPAMLEAVRAMCARAQVAAELAMEAPMACGFGACFGCAVPLAAGGFMRLCVDGPVVNAAEIDTALVPGSGH
jgi:NAD(P)H-flavin reductase